MSDPTKQAATAKTTREAIKEAVNVMAAATAWNWSDRTLEEVASDKFVSEPRPSELRLHAHAEAKAALALRALLDAPDGAVQGAEKALASAVGWLETHDAACQSYCANWVAPALAALRASPESVGGAGVSDHDDMRAQRDLNAATAMRAQAEWRKALLAITPAGMTWPDPKPTEIETLKEATAAIGRAVASARTQRDEAIKAETRAIVERDALKAELDRVAKERADFKADLAESQRRHAAWVERADKAEADLAAARGEVERAERLRDAALKLIRAVDDALSGRAEDPVGVDQRAALRYARDNLGIAFSWKEAPRPATPPLAIRVPCAANGCRWDTTDPSGRCGAHRDGWAEKVMTATPPPASEGAVSERARWIADAALRLAVADVGWSPSDDDERCSGPKIVQEGGDGLSAGYVEAAVEILAASERTAKGEGAT